MTADGLELEPIDREEETGRRISIRLQTAGLLVTFGIIVASWYYQRTYVVGASVAFLGFSAPLSWGTLINEGLADFPTLWWQVIFPGIFLVVTTLAFAILGDDPRDVFDPRMGGR